MSRKTMLKNLRELGFSDAGLPLETFQIIATRHGYSNVHCSTIEKLVIFRNTFQGSQIVIPRGWYFRTCERMFEAHITATEHGCTFGIEFEGGIQRENGTVVGNSVDRYAAIGKWGTQGDPTASFEITTPILHDENEGAEETGKQWIQ